MSSHECQECHPPAEDGVVIHKYRVFKTITPGGPASMQAHVIFKGKLHRLPVVTWALECSALGFPKGILHPMVYDLQSEKSLVSAYDYNKFQALVPVAQSD